MAALLAGSLLVGACAGGEGRVVPRAYADGVCRAIGGWVKAIEDRNAELSGELSPTMSPEEGRDLLAAYLDDVIAETEEARAAVEAAGIPDVEEGEEIAAAVLGAMTEAEGVLEEARARVEEIPTGDGADFEETAAALGADVEESLGAVGEGLSELRSEELSRAAGDVASCREL